jgi:Proteasome subunit
MLCKAWRIACCSCIGVLLGYQADASSQSPFGDSLMSTSKAAATLAMLDSHSKAGHILDRFIELKARKTGTTIAGAVCRSAGCVVLGADTRATNDKTVADKNCEKIHRLAANIYCCGAGTSADCDQITKKARLKLADMMRYRYILSRTRFTNCRTKRLSTRVYCVFLLSILLQTSSVL